jgi:hypothetical protein
VPTSCQAESAVDCRRVLDSDRRKQERLGLAIPVRVQGYQAGGATWEELSTTIDVSERGACFLLNHPL